MDIQVSKATDGRDFIWRLSIVDGSKKFRFYLSFESFIQLFRSLRLSRIGSYKIKQTTFIYCEKCGFELVSSDSLVSDTYDDKGDNHVLYKCKQCSHECDYNFDIAPIPIKWSEINHTKEQA